MRRIRNNKRNKTIFLVALLVLVTIGYAYLSQLLTINGNATIDNAKWDIHFENYQATSSSNVTPSVAPDTSGNNKTTISYEIDFATPGEVYEFTVDTVNGGTIDAMIKNYASTIKIGDNDAVDATNLSNIPDYLVYTITYSDGTTIQNNHLLAADSSETIKLHLEFKEDITAEQLAAASGKTITFAVTANYYQPDETSIPVPHPRTIFTVNEENEGFVNIGQAISNTVTLYDTVEDAREAFDNNPVFLKHTINADNVVLSSYAGFVISDAMAEANPGVIAGTYYIKGGINESDLPVYSNYEKNKEIMNKAFGYATDTSRCDVNGRVYRCRVDDIDVRTSYTGVASATKVGVSDCTISNDGSSDCYRE